MTLSCDCGFDDYEWYYEVEDVWRVALTDFKCYGCCEYHKAGEHVRHADRYEMDEDGNDSDHCILGRICEPCADQYDSLIELGFCLTADWGFVKNAMREYRDDYVPRELKHGNDGK